MGFLTGLGKFAIGSTVGRSLVGGAIGGAVTGSWGGAAVGAAIGGFPGKSAGLGWKGAKLGWKGAGVGWKAAGWAAKNPATAGFVGLGAYGAYSMMPGGGAPENAMTGQDARAAYATAQGTSVGAISPVFRGSTENLVQGLHQGRHR